MKKMVLLIAMAFPISVYAITTAYSPSTPGQPLIFHHTRPSISPFEQFILDQLSCSQIKTLSELSKASSRLSEGLLGLVGNLYLPNSPKQEKSLTHLYNKNISASIDEIDAIFSSSKMGKLINRTLTKFVEVTNEMLLDTIDVSSNLLFQNDYQKMQVEVINHYKARVEELFKKNSDVRAKAESSLEGMVSTLTLYISSNDSLVNGDSAYASMVLARQQLVTNLIAFVESSFVLEAINRGCHEK